MPAYYERDGFRFAYPENWRPEEQPTPEGWSVTLQGPGTAFMLISADRSRPAVRDVLDTTLAALRTDYPDLEFEEAAEPIAHRRARGHDVHFIHLDLTNTCWVRALQTARLTVMVLSQVNDLELDYAEPVFRAIRASMAEVGGETYPPRPPFPEREGGSSN
jgi:hypothetical protein